ncbi:MAG TPA: hypothetical protein PKA06_15030, partial [Gemmatales bacterium]|nr:hypothetical protein [Gemmatales bacterium]
MIILLFTSLVVASNDEIPIGPEKGQPVPSLKVTQIHGEHAGKQLDAKDLAAKGVIYVTIQKDHWDRPIARVLKLLDQEVSKLDKSKPTIFVIWISKDSEHAEEYLPKAQQSLKLQSTSWNHFHGEIYDATGWQLSSDGPLNIVYAKEDKVLWGCCFTSLQERHVYKVMSLLK